MAGGRLPGWHGPAPHVLFETGGGEDKDQADGVRTGVLEAYPIVSEVSKKVNRSFTRSLCFLGCLSTTLQRWEAPLSC